MAGDSSEHTTQELTEPLEAVTQRLHPVTLPPTTSPLPSGEHARPDLNALQKQEVVGRGGMGVVHAARDPVLRRDVALKVMRRKQTRTSERRFVTEAQVTAQLEHPYIVPIYSCDLSSEPMSYSMKLVHGSTLTELIEQSAAARRKGGVVPPELQLTTLLHHLVKVCEALAYAHDKGVVHRDLKPDNIMVGDHGQVYVMDWGLARVRGAEDILDLPTMNDMTLPGYALGSVGYMAPEQALGQPMGPPCDQYALGLILFQVLAGRRARPRPDDLGVALERAASGELRPLAPMAGESIPPDLRAIVERATAFAPGQRFPSIQALGDALKQARTDALRPPASRTALWLAVAALLVMGMMALGAITTAVGGASLFAIFGLGSDAPPSAHAGPPEEQVLTTASEVQARREAVERAAGELAAVAQALLAHGVPLEGPGLYTAADFADAQRRPADAAWSQVLGTTLYPEDREPG